MSRIRAKIIGRNRAKSGVVYYLIGDLETCEQLDFVLDVGDLEVGDELEVEKYKARVGKDGRILHYGRQVL